MATGTFTLRVDPKEHAVLVALAKTFGVPVSDLVREFINDGVRRKMDPAAVDRALEEQANKIKETLEALRIQHDKLPKPAPITPRNDKELKATG